MVIFERPPGAHSLVAVHRACNSGTLSSHEAKLAETGESALSGWKSWGIWSKSKWLQSFEEKTLLKLSRKRFVFFSRSQTQPMARRTFCWTRLHWKSKQPDWFPCGRSSPVGPWSHQVSLDLHHTQILSRRSLKQATVSLQSSFMVWDWADVC